MESKPRFSLDERKSKIPILKKELRESISSQNNDGTI